MREEKTKSNIVNRYKIFLLTLTLMMAVAFAFIYIIELEVRSSKFETIEINEKRVVSLENDYIGNEFRMILSDLNYIDSIFDDGLTASHTFEEIKNEWMHFSSERFIYDKIRFIDTDGDERISIIHSNDEAYIVPDNELEWQFMLENQSDITFGNRYPVEWNAILKGKTQFLSTNGLFTSEIVNFETMIDSRNGENRILS